MSRILVLAKKEVRDGYRNRWIILMTLVLATLALVLSLLGSAPVGTTNISPLAVTVVSLSSLSIFFIPLIALLLSYDSIVGEEERGTLTLLLSHPISKTSITLGKFLGQFLILSFVIVVGYGAAVLALSFGGDIAIDQLQWSIFFKLLYSSILLGGVFLALGILLSICTKDRGTAAAYAIGLWLLFVVLFDMALLGVLSSTGSSFISDEAAKWIMLSNPADAYRMFNLAGSSDTAVLSGMSGLRDDQGVPNGALLSLLCAWIVVPLMASCILFQRKSI
ncbi:MAG: ABC transporter permease subunit [Sneathiella sp.]